MTRRIIYAAVSALLAAGALSSITAPAHATEDDGTYCLVTSPDPDGRRIRDICVRI